MLFLLISILILVPGIRAGADQLSTITFSAKKSDVYLSSVQKPVRVKGEYLEVTLKGRLISPGIDLPLKVTDTSDR
ncbi:MAG: hypothetical protein C4581_04910 [Nitrospiraceae bacterium]|nr:MAG: hypothetical protein C4581_04910 [Nitrospiraceae bacterium]